MGNPFQDGWLSQVSVSSPLSWTPPMCDFSLQMNGMNLGKRWVQRVDPPSSSSSLQMGTEMLLGQR